MYLCCVFLLGCLDDWLKGVQYGVCVLYVCHVFCQLLSLCTYSLGGFIFILIFAQSYLDLLLTSGVFTWRYCNSFSACLQCCEVPQCFSWYDPFPVSWGVRCCTPSILGRTTQKNETFILAVTALNVCILNSIGPYIFCLKKAKAVLIDSWTSFTSGCYSRWKCSFGRYKGELLSWW